VINPFSHIEEVEVMGKELSYKMTELRPRFKKPCHKFWLQKEISYRYPALWTVVKEHGFDGIIQLLSSTEIKLL
jgi:hypothetical protein